MSRARRKDENTPEPCDCPACSGTDIDPAQLITALVSNDPGLAEVDDALDAEMIGAGMVTIVAAAGLELPPRFQGQFVDDIEARADRGALALLSAIGSIACDPDDLARLAAAAAERLAGAGVPRPRWAAELAQPPRIGDCLRLNDPDNGMTVLIAPFERAGQGHALVVATDEEARGAATDILFVDTENLPHVLRDVLADSPNVETERLGPGRLRWYVEEALDARDALDAEDPYGAAIEMLEDGDDDPGPPYQAQAVLVRSRLAAFPKAERPAGTARVYQLKVSLRGAKPPIWRRLLVPADVSLAGLHHILQAAFDWHDSHLHVFSTPYGEFGEADPELGYRAEERVTLERVARQANATIRYTYDFGDDWVHQIVVEKILDRDPALAYPRCTAGRRAAPPEDSGGIWGYEGPATFDPEEVNRALRVIEL